MYILKFKIKSEQLTFIDKYLSTQEIQAAREEKDTRKVNDEFDLISDNEEDTLAVLS